MTKKLKFIGAALVALAILPAAVLLFHLSLGTVFSLGLGDRRLHPTGVRVFPNRRQFRGRIHRRRYASDASAIGNGKHGRRAIDRHRYRYHVHPHAQFQPDGGASVGLAACGAH